MRFQISHPGDIRQPLKPCKGVEILEVYVFADCRTDIDFVEKAMMQVSKLGAGAVYKKTVPPDTL
ncbi:MAG: hypothetical protein BMS9Abin15_0368 [Gammaproteobacteria bacterium]|nr:MAG: hypothetical protein BMS9Abin15_0368 [Gammaproteobacteria bacterium]